MKKRIVVIWFPHLVTDWMVRRQPSLKDQPFILALNERGRRVAKAINTISYAKDIRVNMPVADCRAIVPDVQVLDYNPDQPQKLLSALADWCIRYAPSVAVYLPDCLILDVSGCTHLWGGEVEYLKDIERKFKTFGYTIRFAMADTAGTAWAVCRFSNGRRIIPSGTEKETLSSLPPAALRVDDLISNRLAKLGLNTIGSFMNMPRTALRRRFGQELLMRLDQAFGAMVETFESIRQIAPYEERLPSIEPIRTAVGIEIALQDLLQMLCLRLQHENKGLRKAELKCYRMDGVVEKIEIGTNKPSRNTLHLFKLFELKIPKIEPDLGIELFTLEATIVEELQNTQDALWSISGKSEADVAELLVRLAEKNGSKNIYRFLPDEHYWPKRSYKLVSTLSEKATTEWRCDLPRPLHVL